MKRPYLIMSLLVLLFAAPGLIAYIAYLHPNWLHQNTNHGKLLQPPPRLHTTHPQKWQLLYWSPQSCTRICMQRLDALARLRLALGRRLYYVDLVLAMSETTDNLAQDTQNILHNMDVHSIRLFETDAAKLGSQSAIYLVDAQNYVILAYDEDQSMQDIFQDLQKMVHDK